MNIDRVLEIAREAGAPDWLNTDAGKQFAEKFAYLLLKERASEGDDDLKRWQTMVLFDNLEMIHTNLYGKSLEDALQVNK